MEKHKCTVGIQAKPIVIHPLHRSRYPMHFPYVLYIKNKEHTKTHAAFADVDKCVLKGAGNKRLST